MTMKVTRLTTHWEADEAYSVIAFLDELRDALWSVHGDDIIAMHQNASDDGNAELDDNIDF